MIIMIIIIITKDIYKAPFLSRAHSDLRTYTTSTIHKQQSHLITCNLLTKHTHTHTHTEAVFGIHIRLFRMMGL